MIAIAFVLLGGSAAHLPVLTPCALPGLVEMAECGVVAVPLFHEKPSAGSLPLHFALLRATNRPRQPDPLFLLAGGPGQGARSYAAVVPRGFGRLRRTRDIVLVDLRGTGASRPLDCPGGDEADLDLGGAGLAGCRASLPADLSAFTTERQVRDLDLVREALGHARINLWGGSFGTRAALVYARLFADRVRSVVLDGAAPFEHVWPLASAQDSAAALEHVFRRCEQDAACAAAYPRLRTDFEGLLRRLERAPIAATVPHPRTGLVTRVTVDRRLFVTTLKVMLYRPEHTSVIPLVITRLGQGDVGPLLASSAASGSWSVDTMALGLTLRILCAEDVPLLPREAEAQTRGTFLGSSDLQSWSTLCKGFEAGVPGDRATRPLAIPALILSGALDPVTPPRWGEVMRRHFPRSAHVVVEDAAHNVSFGGCMPEVIARFVEAADPAAAAPTPCATRAGHGGFVLDASAARP